jgi:hypothetical protein
MYQESSIVKMYKQLAQGLTVTFTDDILGHTSNESLWRMSKRWIDGGLCEVSLVI